MNNPLVEGSLACVVAAMLTLDRSSSVMVTVALALETVVVTVTPLLSVILSVMITVSGPSTKLSSVTVTGIVTLVVLAAMVTVLVIVE